jgi:uncharacterized protein YdhG (YjbR/CyaY superfamily)
MEVFEEYLARVDDPRHRARMREIFGWIMEKFPRLEPRIAWNQPIFTDHGTFIIGFSAAAHHLSVAPERATIERFAEGIARAGCERSKELMRIRWEDPVDFALLGEMIEFNMAEKAECASFWRR